MDEHLTMYIFNSNACTVKISVDLHLNSREQCYEMLWVKILSTL